MDDVKGPVPRHERTDANHGAVLKAGVALVALIAFALVLMWLLFLVLGRGDAGPSARSPLATSRPAPSGPQLQVSPARDLAEKRRAEDDVLTSYGWIDADKAVVRIPIERAMDLLAQRGLR